MSNLKAYAAKLTLAAGIAALVLTAPAMAQQTGAPRWYPTRPGLTNQQGESALAYCRLVSLNNLYATGDGFNVEAAYTGLFLCMADRGFAYRGY